MPGYTYFFVDTVPKQCICPICKLPMQSPVVLSSCRHTFCDSCLRPRRNSGRMSLDLDSLMCPLDEQIVDQRNVHVSLELREAIESCMVRCPQEPQGCRWVDIVKHVPSHLESCRFVAVPCPENCGDMICRVLLKDHLGHACPRRRRECPFCRVGFSPDELQRHEGSCPEEQVWCENKCGQRMARRRLGRHVTNDCAKREVSCAFCKKRFLYDSLQVHIQQCTLKGGVSAAAAASSSTQPPIPPHHQHLHHQLLLQQPIVSTTASTSSSAVESAAASTVTSTTTATVPSNGKSHTASSPSVASPDATLDRSSQPQRQHQQQVYRHQQEPLQPPPPVPRRVASAECLDGASGNSGGGSTARGAVSECPLKWCGCPFKGDSASLDRHQKDAAPRHVTLLAELARAQRRELDSLKRQLRHLPAVHNGHLVWRIDNCKEKLAESRGNAELEFCSVPFYTGRPGYRLQASVFLNGNGASAQGRYLSLYVKLLPGEFDPVLDWPFGRPIRMRLLDQSEARAHLEESFAPDPTWRHFRRPAKDAAAALGFGFPRFAAHELLSDSLGDVASSGRSYVMENSLFLEILVEPG